MPVDVHIHIGREDGAVIKEPREESMRRIFAHYRDLGFTFLRDCGDRELSGLLARKIAPEYGITFKTPVYALSKAGGYGAFIGRQYAEGELLTGLEELMELNPDFIKVIQSGIVSFDEYGVITKGGFSEPELRLICDFAHKRGLSVAAHCNGAENIGLALRAGVSSIEHGYFIGREQLLSMRERGAVWVPTFVPLSNYQKHFANAAQRAVIEKTLEGHTASLRMALDAGVNIAVGSDAGAISVPHGEGALSELDAFRMAGLGREDLIKISSYTI